jgi:hypothetical protein
MSASLLDKVTLVMFTSFGTMLIGLAVARAEFLPEPARKGVSLLYAKLVFPMMVFRGVAEINLGGAQTRHARALLCGPLPCCPCLAELDMTVLLIIFLSKALVAAACVGFGRATLGTMHGRASLSHAAMYAMAASHSFDVTLGIPLATELFPTLLPYVYANQVALSLTLTLAPALCRLQPIPPPPHTDTPACACAANP